MKLAVLLLLGCSGCAWGHNPYDRAKAATLSLEVRGGTCTGFAVGQHVIATAMHCLEFGQTAKVGVDGKLCEVVKAVEDGNDHQFLIVKDCTFKVWVKFGPKPIVGETVFVYGDPEGFTGLLRFGTVAGFFGGGATVFDLTAGHGDSGGAIFNVRGQVIGMVSWGRPPLRVCVSPAFKWTKAQLESVGL